MGVLHYRHGRPTIGVVAGWQVYSGTLDSFLGHVFRGIQAAAKDHACNLLLACGVGSARDMGRQRPAWPFLLPEVDFVPVGPWNTDGLIVVSPLAYETGEQYFAALVEAGFPLVYAGDRDTGPAVVVDNEAGIRDALQHLVEHGHRRIAFIAGSEQAQRGDCGSRLRAYRMGVRQFGLADDPALIAYGAHTYAGGRWALGQLLDRGVQFTAVLASNDSSAIGAMDALYEAGFVIPRDMAVIGFDDRLEARAQRPPLTTVHYPMFDLGYQAVEQLLRALTGQMAATEPVRIPIRLAVRESCGCLPGAPAGAGRRSHRVLAIQAGDERASIIQALIAAVDNESFGLKLQEVVALGQGLVEAFEISLAQGTPIFFLDALSRTLEMVMAHGDDAYGWQAAISVLKSHLPVFMRRPATRLTSSQAQAMLDQAQAIISAMTRGNATRLLIRQAQVADQVGLMTSEFFAAQDAHEILNGLAANLPSVGIRHAVVGYYEAEKDDPVAWSVLQSACANTEQRFPSRAFPPDGLYSENEPFQLALLPLRIQETLWGFVAFDASYLEPCADLARQLGAALRGVRLYQEAVEARRSAEEGKRLAEEANRLKSRFLSAVSHELRTPLNVISGISNILLREKGPITPQQLAGLRDDLETIYISAQHLDALIRDVLDLASSDIGRLRLSCEALDMREEIAAVSVIGSKLARDKGLGWRVEMSPELPRVWGDRTRLRQVLLNLIGNAVKFTAAGQITLAAAIENGQVQISVSDTGLGIPPHEQEVIFDEFRQSERTTARGYGGLGLGLAICKRLVELHGGRIAVRSSGEEGGGSTFYFSLPIMAQESTRRSATTEIAPLSRVLLLVKDADKGAMVKANLAQRGISVETCTVDGETDWLTYLLRSLPDAVALDLGLASEQGWEILRVMKENAATSDIPVLFYALESSSGYSSLLELNYLTKPVSTSALAEIIKSQELLNRPTAEGHAPTVLVVDDEPDTLELHARIVKAQLPEGQVLRARDGREALRLIRQERPALVLLDMMMPEIDGFAVLEAMRQEEGLRNIPVIVITGQALTAEDMARLNWGVASVLEKGIFTADEMMEHVASVLARKHRSGSESQRIVRQAMAYIHTRYTEPIALRDVAAHVGLSERHLTRCFRQEVGMTLNAYLNRYRLRQARALLEAGDKSITEVALAVGFSSSSYFARIFREEMGVSPRSYLRGTKP